MLSNHRPVEIIKDGYEFFEESKAAREALLELIEKNPGVLFTSDLVRTQNPPLYTALKKYRGELIEGEN